MSILRRNLDMMYFREISKDIENCSKSVLLLGPRQTGKSTLIRSLNPDLTINLAREQTFLEFSSQPGLIEKIIEQEKPKTIFIDEVQRLPSLLNTIQAILDERPKKYKFYLTGSSARKLKRGRANLLPGRIISFQLGPLSVSEIGKGFDLEAALAYGTLPGVVSEKSIRTRKEILRTYASSYLKEEIQAEALTKEIEGFSRFLMVAASKSGEFLDYAKLGSLASISQKTSSRFFEILEDTLIVYRLDAFSKNETRRLIQHPKFYFFDIGVLNGLNGNFSASPDRMGSLFEHFIINQIINLNHKHGNLARLSTYRTEAGSEVDLIIENGKQILSIEIKSGQKLNSKDFLGLRRFAHFYGKRHRSLLLYGGSRSYREDFIEALPWRSALSEVGSFFRT